MVIEMSETTHKSLPKNLKGSHLCERHIFLCLFFLLTITGRNEAIIAELKAIFVLNCTFITFSGRSHY